LYRPFGRSYAAPRLGSDELLEDVEGILRAVYAVADSRADATYLRLVSSLDASGGRVRVR
jgi:hypothetical protein